MPRPLTKVKLLLFEVDEDTGKLLSVDVDHKFATSLPRRLQQRPRYSPFLETKLVGQHHTADCSEVRLGNHERLSSYCANVDPSIFGICGLPL